MKNTKIDTFLLCYNEEKMIRHTLNHYSTFSDNITVFDNDSTDNSVAIVKEYFPQVHIQSFPTGGETRDDLLEQLKNTCWKESKADYVIVCDMDEFLYADDLSAQLQLLKEHDAAMPLVIGFNMGSLEFPSNYTIPIYEQVQYGIHDNAFDKQIIFSPKHVQEINYGVGCHTCRPTFKKERMVEKIVAFKLLHFKYLSKEYLYERHAQYAEHLSKVSKDLGYGHYYMKGKEFIDECYKWLDYHLYKIIK